MYPCLLILLNKNTPSAATYAVLPGFGFLDTCRHRNWMQLSHRGTNKIIPEYDPYHKMFPGDGGTPPPTQGTQKLTGSKIPKTLK